MQSSRVLDVDLLSSHELITINLDEFATDEGVDGMVELFVENRVAVPTWVRIVEEITSLGRLDKAHSVAESGLGVVRVPLPLYLQLVSLNLALARRAPRTVLPSALPTQPKEHFYARANHFLSLASNVNANDSRVMDAKATYALARGKLDEASKHFEQLLRSEPTHLYALLGRARIAYARKNYRPAIKAYQTVLSYEPKFLPDPRIGLGLCFWAMGDTAKAQMAWERSLVVHPDSRSTSAMVLLGLSYISSSKKSQLYLATGAQGRTDAYDKGIKLMQAAFKKDNTNPTVAAALASFFLTTGQLEKTVKLAERTIQYAETKALLSEGHLLLARVKQAQGDDPGAMSEYSIVLSLMPEHPIALLALAQSLTRSGGYPDASNIFLGILQRDPRNVEALASLAAIHTHLAFATTSLVDSTNERIKAEELYEKLLIIFTEARLSRTRAQEEQGIEASIEYEPGERMGELENDPEMLIELAKLNADKHDLEKTQSFYIKAAQVYSSLEKPVPLRLSNNLAVLAFLRGEFAEAQSGFEQALAKIAVQGGEGDTLAAMIIALAYNLAVTNEAMGDDDLAKKGYEAVLAQHGEFVDAKARLALLALRQNSPDLAHSLIKEALSSQPSNPEIRALYTYFLISIDSIRPARDFTLNTLREHSRHDLYALCAAGWINYVQARENKDTSREAGKDRAAKFLRTAEFYEKALLLDPGCAFAAQGLAISIAEGTLGVGGALSEGKDGGALSENATRARNSRDALNVFVKVKEAAADGGVFVNIGHCHFARDEWERAIESYETASRRFYGHKNIPTLLYLARSWYHKANKDSSFSDMQHCVSSIKTALELAPNDLAIIFNLALAEQKGFEILSSLPCERRTLDQCIKAGEDIVESQSLFERLTMNPAPNTPYDPTLPGSRMKYGVSLERKRHELVSAQTAFAEVELTRINEAKVIRDAERARLEEIEMARREKERETAEKLEEQRRILREEAREYGASKFDSDDDDKKKRGKGNKRKSGKGKKDGDGSESDEAPEKPKRKKKGKKDADTTDSDEDDDKPKKKRKSKPDEMDLDSDGEEKVRATHSRKAKSKVNMSAEFVSDTDSD